MRRGCIHDSIYICLPLKSSSLNGRWVELGSQCCQKVLRPMKLLHVASARRSSFHSLAVSQTPMQIALEGSSGETGEQEQPKNEPVIIEDTQEQEQDQPPQAEELQLDLSRNDLHFKGSKFKHDGRQPCEGHFPAGLRGGGGSARLRRLGRCCIQCSRVPGRYMLHAGFILMMALHT